MSLENIAATHDGAISGHKDVNRTPEDSPAGLHAEALISLAAGSPAENRNTRASGPDSLSSHSTQAGSDKANKKDYCHNPDDMNEIHDLKLRLDDAIRDRNYWQDKAKYCRNIDSTGHSSIATTFKPEDSGSQRKASLMLSSGDTLSVDGHAWNLKNARGEEIATNQSSPGKLKDGTVFEHHIYNNIPPVDVLTTPNGDSAIIDENDKSKSFLALKLMRTEPGADGKKLPVDRQASLMLPSGDTLSLEGDHWDLKNAWGKELANDYTITDRSLGQKLENGIRLSHTPHVGDHEIIQLSYPNGDKAVLGEILNGSHDAGTDYNSIALFFKPSS